MTATITRAGIARRKNGVPPPDLPPVQIHLGSLEFWESRCHDLRHGGIRYAATRVADYILRGC